MHLPNLHFVIVKTLWTLIKHIKFFAHELTMRFKFRAQAIFNAAKKTHPLLWKIYLYEIFLFILHYISTQTVYIYQKFHDTNKFVKLRAVSKLSFF